MKRTWFAITSALVFALALNACQTVSYPVAVPVSKPPSPKPSPQLSRLPPLAPTTPPANMGAVERFGWQTVEQMRDSFVRGEASSFLAKVSRGFYRGYPAIETSLENTFAKAATIDLAIAIQEVIAEEDKVSVRIKWNRSLELRGGTMEYLAGESVLLFLKADNTLRLIDYRKDPIFGLEGL